MSSSEKTPASISGDRQIRNCGCWNKSRNSSYTNVFREHVDGVKWIHIDLVIHSNGAGELQHSSNRFFSDNRVYKKSNVWRV